MASDPVMYCGYELKEGSATHVCIVSNALSYTAVENQRNSDGSYGPYELLGDPLPDHVLKLALSIAAFNG